MLKLLAIALRLVGLGMMVPILLFLTVAAAQFVDGARDYPLIREVISLTRPVSRSIQQHVPTKIKGYDATPWMVIVFALAVRMACRNYADRLWSHAEYLAHKRSLRRLRAARPANVEALKPVEAKLEELKQAPRKDRDALLRQFIEAKKRLEEASPDAVEELKIRSDLSIEYSVRKKDERPEPPGNQASQGAKPG
ncbi:MAG: hypothetical protein HYY19_04255 [Candidatus Rokubacteria bacterium]|nr:hypothetical protein [Candidatus Rokubacteria bacterium]